MNGRQRALSAAFAAMFLSGLTMMSCAGELDLKAVVFKLPDQINWGPVTPNGNQQAVLFGVRRDDEMARRQSFQPTALSPERSLHHRAVGNMVGGQRTRF
jgi:hypothetical protein